MVTLKVKLMICKWTLEIFSPAPRSPPNGHFSSLLASKNQDGSDQNVKLKASKTIHDVTVATSIIFYKVYGCDFMISCVYVTFKNYSIRQ